MERPDRDSSKIWENMMTAALFSWGRTGFYGVALYLFSVLTGAAQTLNTPAVAPFDFKVNKPPILATNKNFSPLIIGGSRTNDYKNVVAIMLDGKVHCSGTVIGAQTILTAAHCIDGYEDAIRANRMFYLVGSDVTSAEYGPKPIADAKYPGPMDKFQYDSSTYVHDIGVLYTSEAIPEIAATLHSQLPKWGDILNKQPLLFVGFGFNTPLGGEGIKREAPWGVSRADDSRVYFDNVAGKNTCSGDSGGPAFYRDQTIGTLLLTAITSIGDKNCTWGAETRVDAHREWIVTHTR